MFLASTAALTGPPPLPLMSSPAAQFDMYMSVAHGKRRRNYKDKAAVAAAAKKYEAAVAAVEAAATPAAVTTGGVTPERLPVAAATCMDRDDDTEARYLRTRGTGAARDVCRPAPGSSGSNDGCGSRGSSSMDGGASSGSGHHAADIKVGVGLPPSVNPAASKVAAPSPLSPATLQG